MKIPLEELTTIENSARRGPVGADVTLKLCAYVRELLQLVENAEALTTSVLRKAGITSPHFKTKEDEDQTTTKISLHRQ